GSALQQCTLVNGCSKWGADQACPGAQSCQGNAPDGTCTCPAAPAGCNGVSGTVFCESATVSAKCGLNAVDGCLEVTTRTNCVAPSNATATCSGTGCGFTCNGGYHDCGGTCESNNSTATCGASCTPCSAPPANA